MRVTIDLPDGTIRRAVTISAQQGISFEQFFVAAVKNHVQHHTKSLRTHQAEPRWIDGFGELSDLSEENRRILKLIEEDD